MQSGGKQSLTAWKFHWSQLGAEAEDEAAAASDGAAAGAGAGARASDTEQAPVDTRPYRKVPTNAAYSAFEGSCNLRTVKEVTFLGMRSEFVAAGSDCGHLFIWRKATGGIVRILRADNRILNCVQGHPMGRLALVTSGIDYDVKLWEPGGDAWVREQENRADYAEAAAARQREQRRRRRRREEDAKHAGDGTSGSSGAAHADVDEHATVADGGDAKEGGEAARDSQSFIQDDSDDDVESDGGDELADAQTMPVGTGLTPRQCDKVANMNMHKLRSNGAGGIASTEAMMLLRLIMLSRMAGGGDN